jgi:transcriptional regulator with XRE-family HTH domain
MLGMDGARGIADAFGKLVRAARTKSGKTQEDVASLSGLHPTTISQAELGKVIPRLDTLIRIAGALERDPGELIPDIRWRPLPLSPAGEFEIPS